MTARNMRVGDHRPPLQFEALAARGRSRKDGFPTVGAVCDRLHFVNSRKNARSQTAPTIDTANTADFCHGLLGGEARNSIPHQPAMRMSSEASRREYVPSTSADASRCHPVIIAKY